MKEDLNYGRTNMAREFGEHPKKNYWWDVLKIGSGFIAGSLCTIILLGLIGRFMAVRQIKQETPNVRELMTMVEELNDDLNSVEERYFLVQSKKGKASIHTGMPKDSVILLLGQPTEFSSSSYLDRITYRYGEYDTNTLNIEFKKGKVSSVSQY